MAYSANAHGDLKDQLRKCWKRDYDWTLLPAHVQNVSFVATNYDKQVFLSFFMFQLVENICRLTDFFQLGLQGCCQLAQRPTVSNPGSNSRTFVLCNGPC